MKTPSLIRGIITAIVLTIISVPMLLFLPAVFTQRFTLTLVVGALCGVYCLYLLAQSNQRSGKVLLGTLVVGGIVLGTTLSIPVFLLGCLIMIWLLRCISFYRSILSSVTDAIVIAAGLAFASWAFLLSGGSLLSAIWCFFLTQALHPLIPASWGSKQRVVAAPCAKTHFNSFDRAYAAAEEALHVLAQNSIA